MNTAAEPWLAAYVTVALSLLLGLAWAFALRRQSGILTTAGDDVVRDLEARYEQYIAQLRDVSQQRHRLTEQGFEKERSAYEALAQATLRKLRAAQQAAQATAVAMGQARGPQAAAAPPRIFKPGFGFWARHPQLKGGLWGAFAMGIAFFLYTTVQQDGHPVPGPGPGPNASPTPAAFGMPPGAAPQAGQGADAEQMKTLAQDIKKNPDDVHKLLEFAHLLLRAQMLDEARTINDRALRLQPNNLEALTHAAVLSASSGDAASSDIGLDMVLKKDPAFVEAWFFRGMLAMQRGDQGRVVQSFTAYLQHAPPGAQRDRIASMLASLQPPGP